MKYWDDCVRITHGCQPCSPGCMNCWAATEANMRQHNPFVKKYYEGLVTPQGKFNGKVVVHPENILKPLKSKKAKVYQVWNDLFIDDVPDATIKTFMHMAKIAEETKGHTFCVLTKRMERAFKWLMIENMPSNVYIGYSVSNQVEADKAKSLLPTTDVFSNSFISFEPALERVDFSKILLQTECLGIIAGGETGSGARPTKEEWFRAVRNQCIEAGRTFYFKGLGGNGKRNVQTLNGRSYTTLPWDVKAKKNKFI